MCGIVGSIGKNNSNEVVLDGLKELEYRGYDSAGIAFMDQENNPQLFKQVGGVNNLVSLLSTDKNIPNSGITIGHTRWATHGEPSIANAHPQSNEDGTIFVVHNGIIENYKEIKQKLEKLGYNFKSETDTETIPKLIDHNLKKAKNFENAFRLTLNELQGAFAIAAIYSKEPTKLYAAKLGSPLVIGISKNNHIVASDPIAILKYTKEVIYLKDHEMVIVEKDKYSISNFLKLSSVTRKSEILEFSAESYGKNGFPTYMLKEIHEIPATIKNAFQGRIKLSPNLVKLGGLEQVANQLRFIDRIIIVACGTSYYAGLLGEYLIEEIAGIPVEVKLASEFKDTEEPLSRGTAVLAISQSGETADTIAALKKVEDYGILRLGVVNTVGSTIARMTDAGVYCHAGPERAVASTKAFISQVVVLSEIALYLSKETSKASNELVEELFLLADKAEEIIKNSEVIKKIALKYKKDKNFLFIGRHYLYPTALEGALKLKEVSYIHAEGYASGEMKHGPLAMIDKDFPTLAIALDSPKINKVYSNIEEIRARKGRVVAISSKGDKKITSMVNDVIYIPNTIPQLQPILAATVMHLFAYYIAEAKGLNIDQPRNLAKSVTVE